MTMKALPVGEKTTNASATRRRSMFIVVIIAAAFFTAHLFISYGFTDKQRTRAPPPSPGKPDYNRITVEGKALSSEHTTRRNEVTTRRNVVTSSVNGASDDDDVIRDVIDIREIKLIINNRVGSVGDKYAARRNAVRRTWGSVRCVGSRRLRLLFVLGSSADAATQARVRRESDVHGDIVQAAFIDDYHNVSYKHVLALRWAARYCACADVILKLDDDVFLEPYNAVGWLVGWLRNPAVVADDNVIACKIWASRIHRDRKNKWYVNEAMLNGTNYPPYCLGPVIAYTPAAARRLADYAATRDYLRSPSTCTASAATSRRLTARRCAGWRGLTRRDRCPGSPC
ncbi:PREDICTED: beta-1,3-galactosyltransferase 5-like [Priapulus caudatus]|uniref:Hexosyltransferase n=1 Tax=Priapulus caudatus TaxID=37621 RepID=A0ABM1E984_PRICU|nr:PREDICTED: beta-1,3-galactosyltransferase 5-like [Priapulus caudatus]